METIYIAICDRTIRHCGIPVISDTIQPTWQAIILIVPINKIFIHKSRDQNNACNSSSLATTYYSQPTQGAVKDAWRYRHLMPIVHAHCFYVSSHMKRRHGLASPSTSNYEESDLSDIESTTSAEEEPTLSDTECISEQEDVMLLDTDDDYGDGSMSDASCEEDDFEDELSDSDIEQFEDIEPVPAFDEIDSRTDHPSGALIGVLHGEKGATMKFAFLGFFRGKGYTDQNSITAGFKLRSTSFVWLASFLRRCGIQTPNLRFVSTGFNTKLRAAMNGNVLFRTCNPILYERLHGLSSSKAKNTDLDLLASSFPEADPDRQYAILAFFLGFFMASGHVTWLRGREGLTIRYSGITFTRRDIPFLEFLADALRSIGFDRVQLARIHLTIYSTPTNNKLLTNAISIYREHNIPFDQKLSLLDTLLSGKEVLLKDVMNQMTFYDFLGYENLENAFARVIAQDLYSLRIQGLNDILKAAGLPMVEHMDDFDMDRFLAQVETLWASAHEFMGQGIEFSEQAMFLSYIRSCFERRIDQAPADHTPRKPIIRCDQCGACFVRTNTLNNRIRDQHMGLEFRCRHAGCDKVYNNYRGRLRHEKEAHTDQVNCPECGQQFHESALESHMLHEHNPDNEFGCDIVTCKKRFTTQGSLTRHRKAFHKDSFTNCSLCGDNVWGSEMEMKHHLDRWHNPAAPYHCDICYKRYSRQDTITRHKRNVHAKHGMIAGVIRYVIINGIIFIIDKISFGRIQPDYTLRENWWSAAFSRSFTSYWMRYVIARAKGKPIPWHEDDYDFGSDDENDHPGVVVNDNNSISEGQTDVDSLHQSHIREKASL
ncbi:predicted protein [Lichtheimia corymbifera JMRC:FSU:9682]|uniref:C2H2-type domain-containing protein n=1 Tax=Lichtheimia corymbifera JMRC:FSU:9682 TaxID=1263082 RepID=A0A068S7G7_9FUNG|nr:predicted protein [Lichtheimia corymbifera JMRC:FSU:9682]